MGVQEAHGAGEDVRRVPVWRRSPRDRCTAPCAGAARAAHRARSFAPVLPSIGANDTPTNGRTFSGEGLQAARYAAGSTRFRAIALGTCYDLCQVPGHAQDGMYGKLAVR